MDTEEGAGELGGGSRVMRMAWGWGWDCAGQRRVTEPHSENGPIVLLSTVPDRRGGRQLWLNLVGVIIFVPPTVTDAEIRRGGKK